jgi:hypothetical protein
MTVLVGVPATHQALPSRPPQPPQVPDSANPLACLGTDGSTTMTAPERDMFVAYGSDPSTASDRDGRRPGSRAPGGKRVDGLPRHGTGI